MSLLVCVLYCYVFWASGLPLQNKLMLCYFMYAGMAYAFTGHTHKLIENSKDHEIGQMCTLWYFLCVGSTKFSAVKDNHTFKVILLKSHIATDKREYPHNIFLISPRKHMLWVSTTYVFVEK